MKLDLTGLQIDLTEGIKEFVERKTEKLSKFFDEDTICHVTIRAHKEKQHVDIRVEYKGHTYMANENTDDVYYGIEETVNKVMHQIQKTKSINEKKRREVTNEVQNNEEDIEE